MLDDLPPFLTVDQAAKVLQIGRSKTYELTVEFDYRATVLSLNTAKLTRDMGFFTGTQLFLEPVGHRGGTDSELSA